MGFVIESETLATLIHKRFTQSQRDAARQLRLDRWGRINWIDRQQEEEKVLKKEPLRVSGSEFWYGWRQFYLWNGCCEPARGKLPDRGVAFLFYRRFT